MGDARNAIGNCHLRMIEIPSTVTLGIVSYLVCRLKTAIGVQNREVSPELFPFCSGRTLKVFDSMGTFHDSGHYSG